MFPVRKAGFDNKLKEKSELLAKTYIENLKTNLKNSDNFRIYPNVRELLDHYQKNRGYELALLTGNFEAGAKLKLEHAGLWKYFNEHGDITHEIVYEDNRRVKASMTRYFE